MKYAICNETFQDWPFEKAFKYAKELGYDALEFAPFTIHDDAYQISAERRGEVRRLAEENGLQIIGLHWLLAKTEGYYLTTSDADIRQRTAAYIAELARLCSDLGGHIMVLGGLSSRENNTLLKNAPRPVGTMAGGLSPRVPSLGEPFDYPLSPPNIV